MASKDKSVFFTLILRTNIYLFLCILLNIVVYIVGNFKMFLDSLLFAMVRMNTIFSIGAFVFSIVSIVVAIIYGFKRKKSYFFYIIPFFLFMVFSFFLMYFFTAFDFFASGMASGM